MTPYIPPQADILLLRHGAFERAHDDQGRRREQLLPEARPALDALAEALQSCGREAVLYSSPHARAVLSAECIARRLGLPVYADPDLAEVRIDRDPDLDAALTAELWREARRRRQAPVLPSAETFHGAGARGCAALRSAARANPGRLLVAISHGGLIEAVLQALDDDRSQAVDRAPGEAPMAREIGFADLFCLTARPLALVAAP